jgi:hypothetical protein
MTPEAVALVPKLLSAIPRENFHAHFEKVAPVQSRKSDEAVVLAKATLAKMDLLVTCDTRSDEIVL